MTWDRAAWLLAGLSLPLIILFHLLARRRREVTVPSLYLWRRLLENEKPSLRLRRIAADLILILQLLAAALAVTALAGPRLRGGGSRITGPTVLLIDVSAGMSAAGPDGRTRMDEALDEAAALIRTKSLNAELAVLAGGRRVQPVSGFTRSRRLLLAGIRQLEATHEPGNPGTLLKAARALSASRSGARIIFITDGAFDPPVSFGTNLETVLVGDREAGNTGIVLFDVRNLPGGGRQLLLSGRNFSSDTRNLQLGIRLDERVLSEETVELAPGESLVRNYTWQEELEGRLTASLTSLPDNGPPSESLSADDEAYAVLSPENRADVRLYTAGNWFLETLLASHPALNLRIHSLERGFDPALSPGPAGDADLLVFDRIAVPTSGSEAVLAIYPFEQGSPGLPLRATGGIAAPDPVSWDNGHPIMRNVDLSRTSISRGVSISPAPGSRILAESESGPLVLAGADDQRRWTALSFDVLASSLPVSPAFPIMISNALNWLVPRNLDAAGEMMRSGESWPVSPFSLSDPRGRTISGEEERMPAGPDMVGFWTISSSEGDYETGVNLLDSGESDLTRRWNGTGLKNAGESVSGSGSGAGLLSPSATYPYSRPMLTILLMLSLMVMLAEWYAQTRIWRRR